MSALVCKYICVRVSVCVCACVHFVNHVENFERIVDRMFPFGVTHVAHKNANRKIDDKWSGKVKCSKIK